MEMETETTKTTHTNLQLQRKHNNDKTTTPTTKRPNETKAVTKTTPPNVKNRKVRMSLSSPENLHY